MCSIEGKAAHKKRKKDEKTKRKNYDRKVQDVGRCQQMTMKKNYIEKYFFFDYFRKCDRN